MKIRAEASPNIALIKYWGKKEFSRDEDRNLALNASVSMTLKNAKTTIELEPQSEDRFFINNVAAVELDRKKMRRHLDRCWAALEDRADLKKIRAMGSFEIHSKNNFPQGTGMASSASAYAALTLAALTFALGRSQVEELLNREPSWISALARRGSGSAARSLAGPWVYWDGPAARVLPNSWKLFDTIVILSRHHKRVPSSDGHLAATKSSLMTNRQKTLMQRTPLLLQALEKRSLSGLGPLIEEEALEMHAVAQSGMPPIDYLSSETRKILEFLPTLGERDFYFTLDAGPNLHFLSERPVASELQDLLKNLGIAADLWLDEAGSGPLIREIDSMP
jgi:diphosphomevalonate decarboxylase